MYLESIHYAGCHIVSTYCTRQGHERNIQRQPCLLAGYHMITHAHQVVCIIMHMECCAIHTSTYVRLFAGTLGVPRYVNGAFHLLFATLYTYMKVFPPVP